MLWFFLLKFVLNWYYLNNKGKECNMIWIWICFRVFDREKDCCLGKRKYFENFLEYYYGKNYLDLY